MEFISYTIFPLIVFSLAVGTVLTGMVSLSTISSNIEKTEHRLPITLVVIAGILLLAGGILNSKNLQFASLGANFIETEYSSAYVWLSRLGSLAVVVLCIPYFISKLFLHKNKFNSNTSIPVIIIIFFGVSNFLLPGLFGHTIYIDHRSFYPILLIIAVYLTTHNNVEATLSALKRFLFLFLSISLLFLVIDSSRVLAPGYKGWIPGMNSRFWGLAPHANAIGPMAVLLLFLELLVKEKRKIFRLCVFGVAAAVLILAQSKTAIGAAFFGLAIVSYSRLGARTPTAKRHQLHWGHGAVLLLGILAFGALLVLSLTGVLDHAVSRFDGSGVANSVQTMSGRGVIWETAYREFLANPIFGYGPTLWDDDYRRSVSLNFAYHAHNQVLQSLAEAGLVGLVGLLAFATTMIVLSIRASGQTHGVSLAILMLFLFRSVTEVPLHPAGIGNGEMFLMIAMVCIWRIGNDAKYKTIRETGIK